MSADAGRVAVLGDCPLLRHGVARVLEAAGGPVFVLGAGSAEEVTAALERGEALAGDVLLVDLRLPPGCLAEVVARLAGLGFAVLVLSSGPPDEARAALRAGARGCLSRRAGEREMLAAIRLVAGGCSYVSADIAVGTVPEAAPLCHVTDRERQVLELVAHGETDHGIAVRLGISEHTVHSHLDRLRDKIGSRRRADLTRFALVHDLIPAAPG
ncbi:response regulator transcription factor [Streptomyces sp. TBY4]|uniref:response regulator transcription factor n=1 Tax=Streptomyces sp. TBY4 TaxID=2962030 RepID=UPI0020B6CF80|nr:response regulator transcription factor [Streptomyces sp. TBY4]MCP3757892.1 response regulator transcription factor [Streptomyces sp. TBY4]